MSTRQPYAYVHGEHPVLAAHRRLEQLFGARRKAVPGLPDSGLATLIEPILTTLGWRGMPRQIAEALPHELPVNDIEMLRGVLSRLGVDTRYSPIRPKHITAKHCPCLIIRRNGAVHYVEKTDLDGSVRLFDPDKGLWRRVKVRDDTGSVRLLTLANMTQRQEATQRDGLVWPVLRTFGNEITAVFWQSCFISLLGLAVSLYVMFVYDKAIGTSSLDTLIMLALFGAAALGLEVTLREKRAKVIGRMCARFDAVVATNALKSVLGLPLGMSEAAPLGSQLTRFKQFEVGRELFGGSLATSLVDLPFTLLFFGFIFALGGTLGFVPVALAVVLAVIGFLTEPVAAKQQADMGEWKGKSDAMLVEIMTRMQTIKDDNAEDIWLGRASEQYQRYLVSRFKSVQMGVTLQSLAQGLVSIAGVAVLAIGAVEVMSGTLSIGALIAVMAIVWRVLGPIQTVFLSLNRLKQMMRTVRQIEQLMKMKPERPVERSTLGQQHLRGAISMTHACLRHGNRPDLALKAVSLGIEPGEFIAIAGASGSGKSSLLKAMLGLYPLQSGSVRLDDEDIRQLDPIETRQSIAYLPQQPAMFFGTVAQNLRLVAPDASQEELVTALLAVGIDTDQSVIHNGLQRKMFSGNASTRGFAQRIALARVFLRPAPIVLLDEPGAQLDRQGDEYFMRSIAALKGHCTIVMVTERPSHLRLADRVLVMREGQIAAQGKPADIIPALMAQAARAVA